MDRSLTAGGGGLTRVPAPVLALVLTLVVVLTAASAAGAPVGVASAQEDSGETVDCTFPMTLTDATGTEVTVGTEPDRVVALAPSAAQQLWAIGAEDLVVGMPKNQYTAYLDNRSGVTNVVGEDGQPIQEEVVGLEPDLVLAPNVIDNDTVASLRETGLTVYRYDEARSIEDVYGEVERTGLLVGEYEAAANESLVMRGRVAAVRQTVDGTEPPRVYYDLGGGWTAGANTFIDDLIETAGGENVAAAAGIDGYTEISQEVVADADPEVLVVHEGAESPDAPAIQNSTAIREDNVVRVDANYINQPGPRNVEVLRQLAEAFHPTAFEGGSVVPVNRTVPPQCATTDGGSTATGTTEPTDADSPVDGQAGATAGESGPGFGATGTLVALVTVWLLATRGD